MGERDAARYMKAAEGGMLYGRAVKDMGRDELMLVVGFLIEDWGRVRQFQVNPRSRTPAG
jgi:hypothetical protein